MNANINPEDIMTMWSFLHIAKIRNGYELVHSTSRDLRDNLAIINTWSFETKKEARDAAKELKETGSLYGSRPYLGAMLKTF